MVTCQSGKAFHLCFLEWHICGGRQRSGLGRVAGCADEILESGGAKNEENSRRTSIHPVRMGHAPRAEDEGPRPRLDRLFSDLEGQFAFENPESFVFPVVHVQWVLDASRLDDLDEGVLPSGILPGRLDGCESTEPPTCFPFAIAT
jgi:hypothetical protein